MNYLHTFFYKQQIVTSLIAARKKAAAQSHIAIAKAVAAITQSLRKRKCVPICAIPGSILKASSGKRPFRERHPGKKKAVYRFS